MNGYFGKTFLKFLFSLSCSSFCILKKLICFLWWDWDLSRSESIHFYKINEWQQEQNGPSTYVHKHYFSWREKHHLIMENSFTDCLPSTKIQCWQYVNTSPLSKKTFDGCHYNCTLEYLLQMPKSKSWRLLCSSLEMIFCLTPVIHCLYSLRIW